MSDNITGLLEKGVVFEGRLSFEGTVRIGGELKGEIITQGTLIIEKGAKVEAQVQAKKVYCSGSFSGEIKATHSVAMYVPAVFKGKVLSPSLKIEEGVVFEGFSQRLS